MSPLSPSRRLIAASAVVLIAIGAVLVAAPASARFDPVLPPVSDAAAPDTEATIIDMRNQGGVFGTPGEPVTALTPYPASGSNDSTYETAQIVLRDPADPASGELLAYCIDLETDTTIGVHYELGQWSEANVPNLDYVTYILQNNYPQNDPTPGAPTVGKVEAVQAAIWYFTDQFVLSAVSPHRAEVAAIVADAQANAQPEPVFPTLTLDPESVASPSTGAIVGPFVAGGTALTSVLGGDNVSVFADSAGLQPVAEGAAVAQGTSLWAAADDPTVDAWLRLAAVQTVAAGNVFLYDGGNAGRTTAQKLVLAQDSVIPIRALAEITPFAAGALEIDVVIAGATAGQQGAVVVSIRCDDAGVITTRTATLAGGAAAGGYAIDITSGIRAGTVCSAVVSSSGATAQAVLASSAVDPASVVIDDQSTSLITVTNTYVAAAPPGPAPDPTPTPSPSRLPDTGSGATTPWGVPAGLMTLGGLLLAVDVVRRRRAA